MKRYIAILLCSAVCSLMAHAQIAREEWTLQACINHALNNNLQLKSERLSNSTLSIYTQQAIAGRYPSVSASLGRNYSWSRAYDSQLSHYGNYGQQSNSSVGISSSVQIFNGFKTERTIEQRKIAEHIGEYDMEATIEAVSLQILDAYFQLIFVEEQLKNATEKISSTQEQLRQSAERVALGAVSKLEYLQIKSQLAAEQNSLTTVENNKRIAQLQLQQLMQLAPDEKFSVQLLQDDFSVLPYMHTIIPDSVIHYAYNHKPEVKRAELNEQVADLSIDIAKSAYYPRVSLSGSVGTGYSQAMQPIPVGEQLGHRISPGLGVSVSIPIYQNNSVRSQVSIATIQKQQTEVQTLQVKDQLKKTIEILCAEYNSSQKKYISAEAEYEAAQELYSLATEKFNVGLINPVEYYIQKTAMTVAENSLAQAKYSLLLNYKIIDFYVGKQLEL